MRHLLEAGPQRAHLDRRACVVLLDREGLLDQILGTPRADHTAKALGRAGRRDQPRASRGIGTGVTADRNGLLAGRIGQRVGVRDQVKDVISVQVRDQHRVELGVVEVLTELREDAVAAVKQQPSPPVLDQVSAARSPGILPGGRFAEDSDAHRHDQL